MQPRLPSIPESHPLPLATVIVVIPVVVVELLSSRVVVARLISPHHRDHVTLTVLFTI